MHAVADTPTACENCGTMLQGAYCHACGQSAHNPLHDVRHAVEEVFESFWHLDGRAFRTLRELPIPGRVACNYLAGRRVRYIPPLRLFIVLTVLTFFVGRLLFSGGDDGTSHNGGAVRIGAGRDGNVGVRVDDKPGSTFKDAKTEAEVIRLRDKALEGIVEGRKAVGLVPIASQGLARAEAKIRADADIRIAQLRKAGGTAAPTATSAASPSPAAPVASAKPKPVADPDADLDFEVNNDGARVPNPDAGVDKVVRWMSSAHLRDPKQRWNATTNPVDVGWLPAWGDRWFNHKLQTIAANVRRFSKDDGNFPKAFVGAMPTALFVMMPVFALLLRLFYVRRKHGVLEHLVVALYSHAFLLLALTSIFILSAIGEALVPAAGAVFYLAMAAIICYIPIYLLVMQNRVYGQGWPKTLVKYVLIGSAYQFLLGLAATLAALLPFLGGE